jgi:hypothetical protein
MTAALNEENMSPKLMKVAEVAKRDSSARFYSLAYLIDEDMLARAFHRVRRGAAVDALRVLDRAAYKGEAN